MSTGVRHVQERVGDGSGVPVIDAEAGEEMMHVQPGVGIVLGDGPPQSPGTLYVTNKRFVWLNDAERAIGYAVDFLAVSLHAISRDPAAYPHPCIYAQIDTVDFDDEEEPETSQVGSDVISSNVDLSRIGEIRLVPSDPNQLDTLFEIFCECAELNPDQAEDNEEDSWVFGEEMTDEVVEAVGGDPEWDLSDHLPNRIGHSNGPRDPDLAERVLQLQIDDWRFEDAEEVGGEARHEC